QVYRLAKRLLSQDKPDAVVLVDFPGFNWWIAKAAKRNGIPVYYYMPPQLWAWAPWRIRRVRKWVDHVLCALPFEFDWYRRQGVSAEFVGHPFFDEVAQHRLDRSVFADLDVDTRLVGLLPGSRTVEVKRNWPVMLDVVRKLHVAHPDVVFVAGCFREQHREFCRRELDKQAGELPIRLTTGVASEVIDRADCCLMVSGSISLELLARTTPAVVIYRCSWMIYAIVSMLIQVRWVTLTNLIAGESVSPEFNFVRRRAAKVDGVIRQLDEWLGLNDSLENCRQRLHELRDATVETGASARTAEAILSRHVSKSVRKIAA
ncbi:MAG: lipid-A-disaccharide synthase, partial [Planctomycetota bacterium]|nr:lipid-A-disaccharide synthase [Planctomycetota bacterium]